jgi:hypothetical protein
MTQLDTSSSYQIKVILISQTDCGEIRHGTAWHKYVPALIIRNSTQYWVLHIVIQDTRYKKLYFKSVYILQETLANKLFTDNNKGIKHIY